MSEEFGILVHRMREAQRFDRQRQSAASRKIAQRFEKQVDKRLEEHKNATTASAGKR